MLVILAAIDAAYSGDWSRIGVLSKEAELGLQSLLGLLGLFHVACGGVTAIDAAQKGYNPVPQTLKAGPRLTSAWSMTVGSGTLYVEVHKDASCYPGVLVHDNALLYQDGLTFCLKGVLWLCLRTDI